MMTAFLAPLINNAYFLVRALLHLLLGVAPSGFRAMSPGRSVWFNLVPLVVLGALWFYHRRVRTEDEKIVPASEASAVVRQLYVYLFTLTGLLMFSLASITLLRWLLVESFRGGSLAADTGRLFLAAEIARLAVSLPLWLLFWRYAQGLFYGPAEEERQSIVRKAYLYLVIFGTVMTVVTVVTIVLSDAIKRLMDIPSEGGDIREAIAILIVAGLIWAYHAFVLRRDAEAAEGQEQAANIRRLYLYLTAGIGLAAVLTGLVGVLNALIRALATSGGFIVDLREQLGIFLAILLAGLPLWLINWYRAQQATYEPDPAGRAERQSLVRRLYLFFYLLLATLAFLGSAIYILSQIIELALGAREGKLFISDIGQALAYMVIAIAVWLYHGSILRREWRLAKTDEASKLRPLRVAIVDTGDGSLGQAIIDRIHQQLPGVELLPLGLSPEAAAAMNGEKEHDLLPEKILAEAELIVGPWNMAMSSAAGGLVTESIAQAVVDSPAPKVIIPVRDQGWEWIGVESWKEEDILKETTAAVKQAAIGEEIEGRRRLGGASIALIVVGGLFALCIVVPSIIGLIFSLISF